MLRRTVMAVSALGLLTAGANLLTACDKTKPVTDAPTSATDARPSIERNATTTPTPMPSDIPRALAVGSNALAFDLWGQLAKGGRSNAAFSPASISIAFAMTYGGAKGETAEQIEKVLHFEGEPAALGASWGALGRELSDPSRPIKLRIANRLYGEKTYAFVPEFLERTKTSFGAPLELVDFKTAPEPARQTINAWVEQQTEKRIKGLLPPQSLEPLTRMVLVNAIYFLGDWAKPFEPSRTSDEPFHTSASATKRVPTMKQTDYFGVGRTAGVNVLELPYKGNTASLLLVVPENVDGLAAVEATLSSSTLETWKRAATPQNVSVWLPRFAVNPAESLPLSKHLTALGMPIAFDRDKADFTGIGNPKDEREKLHIAEAFHKAFVKVDEKGTEAAAATAVVTAEGAGMPAKPIELKIDRPFLFFVLDKPTGLVLFMGRVTEP